MAGTRPERRQHLRLAAEYEYYARAQGLTLVGLIRDVSPYGIGLFSEHPLPAQTPIEVKTYIPYANLNIEAKGLVVFCVDNPLPKKASQKYLIGIRFLEGPLEDFSIPDQQVRKIKVAPSHSITIEIAAPRCYELLASYERYPEWASGIKKAVILEKYPDGRGRRVDFEHDFFFRRIHYVLDYTYDDRNLVLSWVSTGGDTEVVSITGSYSFKASGPVVTFANYQLDIALSIIPSQRLVHYATNILMRKEMKNFRDFVKKNS
jgi:hypothetical protein